MTATADRKTAGDIAIDVLADELLSLKEAAEWLTKRVNSSLVVNYRAVKAWGERGTRASGGKVLATVLYAGKLCTIVEALEAFLREISTK